MIELLLALIALGVFGIALVGLPASRREARLHHAEIAKLLMAIRDHLMAIRDRGAHH